MQHEPVIRLAAFALVLAAMAGWELAAPRRPQALARKARWPGNLGVVMLDTLIVRLLFPAGAVGLAVLVEARGWGLLNAVDFPGWSAVIVSVIALDLVLYVQHVLFHAIPTLWRIHRMHHADLEVDVTTGVRFHPAEIVLSMLIKLAAIAALGAPPVAVLAFEILLNASSMFSHGNVGVPLGLDRIVRLFVVTPDMHRVHHSIVVRETNSNFGFNLALWDRLFGTYRAEPEAGQQGMTLGLKSFRNVRELRLDNMLLQPLRSDQDSGETPGPA